MYSIKNALAFLLPNYDLVLAGDQDVDWRVHIIFMPRVDPLFAIEPPGKSIRRSEGTLGGPVARMLSFASHGA